MRQAFVQVEKEKDAAQSFCSASAQGKDLSGKAVGQSGHRVATDCIDVKNEGDKLIAKRPMYAGKCLGEVVLRLPPRAIAAGRMCSPSWRTRTPAPSRS